MKNLLLILLFVLFITSCFTKPDPEKLILKEKRLDSLINVYNEKLLIQINDSSKLKQIGGYKVPLNELTTITITSDKDNLYLKLYK